MKKVYIAREIDSAGIDLLKKQKELEVKINTKKESLSKQSLIEEAKGSEAIVTLLTDIVDKEVMDGIGKQLKIISNYAVGYDNIDIKSAKERNIVATNTPEVMTQAVAEHAIALMLCCARRIGEGDRYVRAGNYKGWEPDLLLGPEIAGKNLGIIGMGRIGESLAQTAYHGFGMKIYYHDLNKNEELERNLQADYLSLNSLLERSDFISIHVPLNKATHHLIGKQEFVQMKDNAILVNTARGAVIDEKALINALKDKQIFAAGIDVYEDETSPSKELYKLENIILTPHIASATIEARKSMALNVASNVINVLNGKAPLTPIIINK